MHLSAARSGEEQARNWKDRLTTAIEGALRKQEKQNQHRAAAAKNANENRRVGTSIRRQLEQSEECPYCGDPLGSDPHCDHIYPVAKGGRSTRRNMVWVCSACNLKKGDQTHAFFIKCYDLDREGIEERLAHLGKEF